MYTAGHERFMICPIQEAIVVLSSIRCVHILQLRLCYCCYLCISIPLLHTSNNASTHSSGLRSIDSVHLLSSTYICVLPQQRTRSADSSTASPNHTLHLTKITIQQASPKSCGTGLADMACETCSFALHHRV